MPLRALLSPCLVVFAGLVGCTDMASIEAAGLSGALTQDANGHLSGTLTWAMAPPFDYHYTASCSSCALRL